MLELSSARAKVRSVNLRAEKHGDDGVPAVDIRLELDRPATDLAMFGPRLRAALFWRDPDADGDLLDDPDHMPHLRCPEMPGPFAVEHQLVGARVVLDYGLGGRSDIALDAAKVNRIKVTPVEGGSVRMSLRVQAAHIDESIAGRLAMMIDRETAVTIDPAEATLGEDGEGDDE